MKKSLSLLLAFTMVFTMFASFALAETAELDAQAKFEALVEKGIFSGFEDGSARLDEEMTRAQAAVIISLLFQLDIENAPATPTFSDVPSAHWAYNYVEAAAAAGIISGHGDGTFEPGVTKDGEIVSGQVTVEQLATMLVQGFVKEFGYEIDEDATVSGDASAWAQKYVAAAIELGFLNAADDYKGNATRELLVEATYNAEELAAIEIPIRDLAVEEVAINSASEIEVTFSNGDVEVYELDPALEANTATEVTITHTETGKEFTLTLTLETSVSIESAEGLSNALVEVKLAEEVGAVSAAEFSIKDEDGEALAITDAELVDSKTVRLTTEAQEAAALYVVSANGTSAKFVGQVADSDAPELVSAVATTNTKVEVTFNEDVTTSALNIANYKIDGLSVLKAEYKKDVKNAVVLTTSSQTQGTVYTVKVSNVADFSLNKIKADSEVQFGGLPADEEKPELELAVAISNTSVELQFNEELDKASAENIANYSINGLSVLKAELDEDVVTLTTTEQTQGTVYTVKVVNVKDVSGNVIHSDHDEASFGGLPADEEKPELQTAVAKTNTSVELTFSENVDKATAENVANYSIEGLTVTAAKVDKAKVTLTTSKQTAGSIYTVKVVNVQDLSGNVIHSDHDEAQFGGLDADTDAPEVVSATSNSATQVTVNFNEDLDEKTALRPYNYYLGSELGYALKVAKGANASEYVLTTITQGNKIYEVKVSDVKDLSGNVIGSENKATFGGTDGTASDTTKPEVKSAVSINKNTFKVIFSEKVEGLTRTDFTITRKSGPADDNSYAGTTPKAIKMTDKDTAVLVYVDKDMTRGVVYEVEVTGGTDKAGNVMHDEKNTAIFAASTAANPAPQVVSSAILLNNQTLRITFTEPVTIPVALTKADVTFVTSDGYKAYAGEFASKGAVLSNNNTVLTIYYDDTAKFVRGDLYKVQLNAAKIYDEFGTDGGVNLNSDKNTAVFAGIATNVTAPKLSAAIAINQNTIDLTFNQEVDVDTANLINEIKVEQGSTTVTADVYYARTEGDDNNRIRLFFNGTPFEAGKVYKLTIEDGSLVVNYNDVALENDSSVNFAAVSTVNADPKLVSATATSETEITVKFSEKVRNVDASDFSITGYTVTSVSFDDRSDTAKLTVTKTTATAGNIYEVSIVGASDITDEAGVGTIDTGVKVKFVAK